MKLNHVQVDHMQSPKIANRKYFNQQISAYVKRRSQLVVRLKAIKKTIKFSLLLFFQLLLLILDLRLSNLGWLLTDQEVTKLKEVILNKGNKLANFISLSLIDLKTLAL